MSLDIVAVTYGHNYELKTFINCLKSQTSKDWRLIIMHDGPDIDNKLESNLVKEGYISAEFAIEFYTTDIRYNDFGHSLRAIALDKYVQNDYVCLTNGDNYYTPNFVEEMQPYMDQKSEVILFDFIQWHPNKAYSAFRTQFAGGMVDMGSFITRADVAKSVGFRHRDFCADGHFANDIVNTYGNTIKYVHINKFLFIHN